jgi:hypothetical protein
LLLKKGSVEFRASDCHPVILESDKIPHSKEFDEETNKKQNSLKMND